MRLIVAFYCFVLCRVRCLGAGFVDALDGRGHDGSENGGRYYKDDSCDGSIDWVIIGGESGHGARPMHPDWARGIRDQCQAAGVAFFFKQWGQWIPGAANGFTQWPDIDTRRPLLMPAHPGREGVDQHQVMLHADKKSNGRMLDGREWNEMPRGTAELAVQP